MSKQSSPVRFGSLCWRGLTTLLFLLAACTPPPPPTTPAAQATAVPPQVNLVIQSDQQEVTVGHPVAILMTLNPPAAVAEAEWTVIEGKGDLQIKANEAVVFTPSEESELMLIQVRGTTADGVPFQSTINFKVVAALSFAVEDSPASTEVASVNVTAEQLSESLVSQDSLNDGQTVRCENNLEGTYDETVTDPIWPIVRIGLRNHPQDVDGTAPIKSNGNWYGIARFGDCSQPRSVDSGKAFELLIITAGPECQDAIAAYFSKSIAEGSYPGMLEPELPSDCRQVVDPIVVIRE